MENMPTTSLITLSSLSLLLVISSRHSNQLQTAITKYFAPFCSNYHNKCCTFLENVSPYNSRS